MLKLEYKDLTFKFFAETNVVFEMLVQHVVQFFEHHGRPVAVNSFEKQKLENEKISTQRLSSPFTIHRTFPQIISLEVFLSFLIFGSFAHLFVQRLPVLELTEQMLGSIVLQFFLAHKTVLVKTKKN